MVSDSVKNVTFMVSKNDELSTVSPEFAAGRISESDMVSQRIVETTTLQKIFEAHAVPQRFELLSIDVEDHDYQVLTSFDICAYRPKVILIEMAYFMPGEPSASRIVQYLREHDYSMRAYTSLNGLFIDLNWAEPHSTAPARP